MDREGEYTFLLRPRTENVSHRLLCEVEVQDNVKLVTLRSTYKVQNQTLYPIEVTLVDEKGRPVYSLEKIGTLVLDNQSLYTYSFQLPVKIMHSPSKPLQTTEFGFNQIVRVDISQQYTLSAFSYRGLWVPVVFSHTMGRPHIQEELHR